MHNVQAALGDYTANINAGVTAIAVAQFGTNGYGSIVGVCLCDVAVNVTVYQGKNASGDLDRKTVTPINAGTTEGDGGSFDIPVVGPYARIDITNPGGVNTATLRFHAALRRYA